MVRLTLVYVLASKLPTAVIDANQTFLILESRYQQVLTLAVMAIDH